MYICKSACCQPIRRAEAGLEHHTLRHACVHISMTDLKESLENKFLHTNAKESNVIQCGRCGQIKKATDFWLGGSRSEDGSRMRRGTCIACSTAMRYGANAPRAKEVTVKVCHGCGVIKPILEFTSNPTGRFGRRSHCKACTRESRIQRTQERAKTPPNQHNVTQMCIGCKKMLPGTAFGLEPRLTSGLFSRCRECVSEREHGIKQKRQKIKHDAKTRQDWKCAQCQAICSSEELEFAHFDRANKYRTKHGKKVSIGALRASEATFHAEFEKGRWLCWKCHCIETWEQWNEKEKKRSPSELVKTKFAFVKQEKLQIGKCQRCQLQVPNDERLLPAFEFDHIDRKNKKASVSTLSQGGCSLDELKEELLKCQLLCRPCHRIKTTDYADRSSMGRKELTTQRRHVSSQTSSIPAMEDDATHVFRFVHAEGCESNKSLDGDHFMCVDCGVRMRIPLWLRNALETSPRRKDMK